MPYDKDFKEFDRLPFYVGYKYKDGNEIIDFDYLKPLEKAVKSYILSRDKALISEIREWILKLQKKVYTSTSQEQSETVAISYNFAVAEVLSFLDSLTKE